MSEKKIVSLAGVKVAASDEAVSMAEELLEQVKSGDIQSFCFAALKPGDDYVCGVGGNIHPLLMFGAANVLRDYTGEILNYLGDDDE